MSEPRDVRDSHLASRARNAGAWAGAVLALLYAATAAPDVTWWDAGEFIAAAHTLGIPHPPGTPLYVMIARVWAEMFGWLGTAQSVNLLSGMCTAGAGALMASAITRATGSIIAGVGAAVCAGSMSTVWLSATEAEVYGPSLLLAMLMLWSGDRAGRSGESKYIALTAYLYALAAPLHVTALVAAPAAILLAMTPGMARGWPASDAVRRTRMPPLADDEGRGSDKASSGGGGQYDEPLRWSAAIILAVALIAAGGIGTGRWWLGAAASVALVALPITPWLRSPRAWRVPLAMFIAFSAFAFLLLRAAHDPAVNQGNPSTLDAMMSVIAREQYAVAGLLPRQAPLWMQIVNFLQYADWQVALGLGPTVMPTVPRMVASIAFIVLGAFGSVAHRHADRRSWRALALLGSCGSLGVILYLNLKAGPSIGYGILPDDAPHEPRERDYFFALAFWTWGLWAGLGAVTLARRWLADRQLLASFAGIAVAALPMMLNFGAMNRRAQPEASLPLRVATELLAASPPRAVLLVAGDNDTYPLWYAQQVLGVRADVVLVTLPLLSARWYREELHRRWSIGESPVTTWRGMRMELASVAQSARATGRPLAVSATVERTSRDQLRRAWRLTGVVYVEDADLRASGGTLPAVSAPAIDTVAAAAVAVRLEALLRLPLRRAIDPTPRLMRDVLECPSLARRAAVDTTAARLLDSTCNYR